MGASYQHKLTNTMPQFTVRECIAIFHVCNGRAYRPNYFDEIEQYEQFVKAEIFDGLKEDITAITCNLDLGKLYHQLNQFSQEEIIQLLENIDTAWKFVELGYPKFDALLWVGLIEIPPTIPYHVTHYFDWEVYQD